MRAPSVLVVERERATRGLLHAMLDRHGYEALEAANAFEALFLGARYGRPVDLLLTATHLEGIDGFSLARMFLRRFPGTAVIFMGSATEGPEKPFEPALLLEAIRKALASAPRRKEPGSAGDAAERVPREARA